MGDDVRTLVVDTGSATWKAGFAGDDAPQLVFPAIVGDHKAIDQLDNAHTLRHPIQHGIVTNWEDYEMLWAHVINDLSVDPERHCILLTEAPFNPKANREKIAQLLFETRKVPALNIALPATLALYSSGSINGIVVDCGESVTHIVPIIEGYAISSGVARMDLAGYNLTQYLGTLLNNRLGCSCCSSSTTSIELEIVKIKEKLAYVAQNYENQQVVINDQPVGLNQPVVIGNQPVEINQQVVIKNQPVEIQQQYKLPDGKVITLSKERFQCMEPLFQPGLLGLQSVGIHELTFKSIMHTDVNIRRELYGNVMLVGGTTLTSGFADRMQLEMRRLVPAGVMKGTRINAVRERGHSAWIGGSIVGSLDTIQTNWITRAMYEEYGPGVMFTWCTEL